MRYTVLLLTSLIHFGGPFALADSVETHDLDLPSGKKLMVTLKRINAPKSIKLPVIIIFGGFETGHKSLDLIDINEPVLLATFDYPYKAPQNRSLLNDFTEISKIAKSLKTTDEGIVELVNYLAARDDVDSSRIAIAGVSFGAPIAIKAATQSPAISYVIIAHGFARVELVIEKQLKNIWCPSFWCKPAAYLASRIAWWLLNYSEPSKAIENYSPRPTLLLFPEADDQVPKASVDALKRAFVKNHINFELNETKGSHITPGRLKEIKELLNLTIRWLKSNNFFNLK